MTCQRPIRRGVLKVRKFDKIRHTKMRAKTKVTDALNYAQQIKWRWAGHIATCRDNDGPSMTPHGEDRKVKEGEEVLLDGTTK